MLEVEINRQSEKYGNMDKEIGKLKIEIQTLKIEREELNEGMKYAFIFVIA